MQVDSKPDTAIANHPEFITAHFATYTYIHVHTHLHTDTPTMQYTVYSLLYAVLSDTSPGQICVCVCSWKIFSPSWPCLGLHIHPQVSVCVFVPVAPLQTDIAATHEIASHLQGRPHYPPFPPFSILHPCLTISGWVYLRAFPSPCLPGHSSYSILSFCNQFFSLLCLHSFTFSPFLCPSPLSWFPSFRHPRSDSVHSCTQYGIDWFPSAFSDLVVIVPERSRQIDFSEKDTVMSWLHCLIYGCSVPINDK